MNTANATSANNSKIDCNIDCNIDCKIDCNIESEQSKSAHNYAMWFRRDLRLHDNSALTKLSDLVKEAIDANQDDKPQPQLYALYIVTPEQWLAHDMSVVQLDFIFRTLKVLARSLFETLNIELRIEHCATFNDCEQVIVDFCRTHGIKHIACNYEYEVNEQQRDTSIAQRLHQRGVEFSQSHDQCILPPKTVTTNDDDMYKVFTPFYKKWQSILDTSPPSLYRAERVNSKALDSERLDQLLLQISDLQQKSLRLFYEFYAISVADGIEDELLANARQSFPAGEREACRQLKTFIAEDISQYDIARDQPALQATSRLSPYLTLGAISPRLCYLEAYEALYSLNQDSLYEDSLYEDSSNQDSLNQNRRHQDSLHLNQNHGSTFSQTGSDELPLFSDKKSPQTSAIPTIPSNALEDIQRWISELAWRDFYRHVIADRPDIVKGNAYKVETDNKINWSYQQQDFEKWCTGSTGVPLVDAAMRCLNKTGFMHNRLRMVTAMFLTKDLLIDWRWGERYFMQQLIDGDFASNNGGWQWSASVGTDAAPYFRIMNPFSQAKTHDKDAIFIKTWLPELKAIPPKILHDEAKLRKALSQSGEFSHLDYPLPMVEHKKARLLAIEQFKS